MDKNKVIVVQNINITVSEKNFDDYICITDIAKAKVGESRGADVVKNWMRNRTTLEFLGTFVLSVSGWIEKTEAIGWFEHYGGKRSRFFYTGLRVRKNQVVFE